MKEDYLKIDKEKLYWDFIKQMDLTKEYKLWRQAVLNEVDRE